MKIIKKLFFITVVMFVLLFFSKPIYISAKSTILFTQAEEDFIKRSQNGKPLKIGIIPHAFPLSDYIVETNSYVGTNIEMLNLISQKTDLQFSFGKIPIEEYTPYESLQKGDFSLVAGTIKLASFINNPNLLLSDRLDDGSLICISKINSNPSILKKGKISVLKGYQAGQEYAKEQFPSHEVISFKSNKEVMEAVSSGKTDIALISRYAGIYELQSPFNENLNIVSPYQVEIDSCIMGLNTPENKVILSIINKGLAEISKNEYNFILMNFSINNPYILSLKEVLYKYRFVIIIATIIILVLIFMFKKLVTSQKEKKKLSRDPLTGCFTEAGFMWAVEKVLNKSNKQHFIVDFDLSNFSTFNELHGKKQGDVLLKSIAKTVGSFLSEQDIICRAYADNFKVLSCKNNIDELISEIKEAKVMFDKMVDKKMLFNFGIYPILDKNISIGKMLDFAAMVRRNVKNKKDNFIGTFNEKTYQSYLEEAQLLSNFDKAILNKEFIAYYQPKYDAQSKRIVGAEALVRWKTANNSILMPSKFIELFEKNALIQSLDFYILEQVCILLKQLISENLKVVPISVNFSRIHLFTSDFVDKIKKVVEQYEIPKHYIEVECTETAITYDMDLSIEILGKLREEGFIVAMDDFGKGYSSLNALNLMPLDIVKLDSGFISSTMKLEKEKANRVVTNVISLIHDLSLKIVAEGVENEEQYLFLKSLNCDYIQGYYFSKPLEEEKFLKQLFS